MKTRIALATALALALVAAGAAMGARQSSSGVLAATRSASGTLIALHKTKYGKVLATSSGRTLYMYKPDTKNHSNCYTGCAGFWPPLTTKGKPRAGTGVKAGLLGVTMRKNGSHQVTYAGHPLYRYSGDSKAGQTSGEGYQSIWWVLNSSGRAVKHAGGGGTTSTPTTTTSPYPGY
jgi:predicted lipoprotein with Yx(FWY)xxD motif